MSLHHLSAASCVLLLSASTALGQQPTESPEAPKESKPRSLTIPSRLRKIKSATDTSLPKRPSLPARLPPPKPRTVKPAPRPSVRRAPPVPAAPREAPNVVTYGAKKTAAGKTCKPPPGDKAVSFDFEGEIQDLVETISKITCKNFILTNKIRSQKFKIVSPTPIMARNAWRVFLAALEANDFAVVPSGRYYKVVQASDGTRSRVPFYGDSDDLSGRGRLFSADEQMVTKIQRLKHGGNINTVVNYLNVFKSNRGQIHPFPSSNLFIITDFASSVERLERVLKEIDQPNVLEKIHIVTVSYASASEIADKLSQVFEPKAPNARGAAAAKPTPRVAKTVKKGAKPPKIPPKGGTTPQADQNQGGSVSKILADDRTNKIIIIASEGMYRQIMALLRQLDVPEDGTDGQIHVLRLKHADAEELSSTLSSLAQGRPTTGSRARTPARGRPAANRSSAPSSAALFQGDVKVTADKATNSLVITASKSDLASMRRVISKLDVPRFQVFVEAAILEVSTTNDRNLGVGWHGGIPIEIDGEQLPLIFANTPNSQLSSLTNTINPLGLTSLLGLATAFRGPALSGTDGLPGVPQGGIPSIGVVLQALQNSNDVNVVSTPHLLTMDNEEAEIQVSNKIPFPSGLSLGGLGGLGNLATQGDAAANALGNLGGLGLGQVSFNREDIGLTLKIKPQINDEDYVRLEIDQELSDVGGTEQVTGQVITSKRSAKTTVVVRSQDSIVIGGLVRDRETRSESKMPLLGDIPVLGMLFKQQNRTKEKVNLVLVLTPYIIRGPRDFRTIFERKMEERREFVDLFYGQTEEYRAKIDWNSKVGPLASYQRRIEKEMQKAENEGPGSPDQLIIRPEDGPLEPEPVQAEPAMMDPDDTSDSEFEPTPEQVEKTLRRQAP